MTGTQPIGAAAGIRARGWGWRHATRRAWALSDVDLDVAAGQRVLLLGASGSGKSTLLAGLAGVLGGEDEGESSGTLTVGGVDPSGRRGIAGLVLQDPDAQAVASRVGDDVAFGCENLGVPREEIGRRVAAALDAVGLDVERDRPTSALSGGQRQRLALAGVLAMRPGLVLLDEPTANLDPDGVVEVRDAVTRALAATGATLVVVEHRVAVWRDAVDRVIVLGEGGVVLGDGAPDAVLAQEATRARLAEAGVWLPGAPPARHPAPRPGEELLVARELAVSRAAPRRPRRGRRHVEGVPAVASGIDLAVRARQALAITGPNGVGKTTLALALGGLAAPAGGELCATEALAGGVPGAPAGWPARALLSRIGSVFQTPDHQFLSRTVREELAIGPRALRLGEREVEDRVERMLAELDLAPLSAASPFTLSGGQRRRLSVATTLATRPRVLVLDEPTFGQDARTWASLVALLAELRDGGTAIVAVTHDAELVAALGAREHRLEPAAQRTSAQHRSAQRPSAHRSPPREETLA